MTKEKWIVEFEIEDESFDIDTSMEHGLTQVRENGIIHLYYGAETEILPWKIIRREIISK